VLGRIRGDVGAARMLFRAGVRPPSIALYPIRRRFEGIHRLDLRSGTVLLAPPDEPLIFLFREIWIDRVYVPMDERPIRTVVDVGAHVGLFTLWCASRYPDARIVAVEPSPRATRYLRQNVARNRLGRVTVVEAACGGSSRRALLYRRGPEMTSTLYGDAPSATEVDVLTLDELFRRHGVERCDLLKLDCEGAEYEILLGASAGTLARVDGIVMECHRSAAHSLDELLAHLRGSGFDLHAEAAPDGVHHYVTARRSRVALEVAPETDEALVPA
jgi:FkbM family methyltransferase